MSIKHFFIGATLLLVGIAGGIGVGRASQRAMEPRALRVSTVSSSTTTTDLINPSVIENLGKHYIINFLPLKGQMSSIQKKFKGDTRIYFDYLNNASWIGLGEKDLFTAASTVKVPLAMAIFKLEESGRLDLNTKYALDQLDLDASFGDLYKVGPDHTFTVNELLEIMLKYSDNTAANALYKVLQMNGISDPFQDVYAFMGWIDFPDFGASGLQSYTNINLKTLSNMFIALYNAQYVNVEHSNRILTLLDESPFNDQIAAGVPKDLPVAHKVGMFEPNNTYTDCGIVYAPQRNYLLCESSTGMDYKTASQFMAEVSKVAYEYVTSN